MEIKVLPLGEIGANCYMLSTEKAAVVIDPGFYSETVSRFLIDNANKERLILLTHAHFDHIGGADSLRKNTDTKIGIGEFDNDTLADTKRNLSDLFHAKLLPFSADLTFSDNQTFSVGNINFKVLHTPGHTPGGVCYLTGDILFSGDTLFKGSIGRTDFYGGDFKTLEKSIKRLYTLDSKTTVFSGHGDATTIEEEKNFNPFIRG
ncbi:MAG: MBL fold metallo-hydrolase [Clostridia bacterium]|nr:MBL fold metallo-hydrolase [Clostridia bacterium]